MSKFGRGNEHARVWRGYAMGHINIALWEDYVGGAYALDTIDHTVRPWNGNQADLIPPGASGPTLLLPEGFAEPLRDALDEMLGAPHDDYRARYEEAREALAVERARVDTVWNGMPGLRAR